MFVEVIILLLTLATSLLKFQTVQLFINKTTGSHSKKCARRDSTMNHNLKIETNGSELRKIAKKTSERN